LNAEQSKQLYQFLRNLTNTSPQKHGEQENVTTHMAGIVTAPANIYNSKAISCLCKMDNGTWILDSGASDHMSFDLKALYDLRPLEHPVSVTLPNGYKVLVTQYGKLALSADLVLGPVLLVPHFKYNLLPIKSLTRQFHCEVIFTEDLCILQDPSPKRPVAVGREVHGQYTLDSQLVKQVQVLTGHPFDNNNSLPTRDSCNNVSKDLELVVWHRRVGHIPHKRLKLLPLSLIDDMRQDTPCDICPKAKQQRLPFPSSSIGITTPFELVHVGIWGPYHTETHSRHRFFFNHCG